MEFIIKLGEDVPLPSFPNEEAHDLPWSCNFGQSLEDVKMCHIKQDNTDHRDWIPWSGLSPTANTGPLEDTVDDYGKKISLST